jgi:uncharacterized phiE125 gp8 family phage protein
MYAPSLITAPVGAVVSTSDLKAHLRVEHSADDALIGALQDAAVAHLDGWRGVLGRAILSQVWRQDFDDWGDGDLRLPLPDVSAVTATYRDPQSQAFISATGELLHDRRGSFVRFETHPDADLVRIQFTAALPAQLMPIAQTAIKLMVGNWYENREAVVTGISVASLPLAVEALVTQIRWTPV